MAPPAQALAPRWLVVLVIVMGLLIVVGTVIVANEMSRRLSSAAPARAPALASAPSGPTGTPFTQRIELPAGAQVISLTAVGDRLVVQVETQAGLTAAYVVDPRTGALLGTIEFPPGVPR